MINIVFDILLLLLLLLLLFISSKMKYSMQCICFEMRKTIPPFKAATTLTSFGMQSKR